MGVTIVTGAAGRIGSAVAAELARRGRRTRPHRPRRRRAPRGARRAPGRGRRSGRPARRRRGRGARRPRRRGAGRDRGGRQRRRRRGADRPRRGGRARRGPARVFDVNVFAIFRVLAGVLPHLKARRRRADRQHRVRRRPRRRRVPERVQRLEARGRRAHPLGCARGRRPRDRRQRGLPGLRRVGDDGPDRGRDRPPHRRGGLVRRLDPRGRYAEPAEIASLVAYLVCDAPAYLTGSALVIDGGLRV